MKAISQLLIFLLILRTFHTKFYQHDSFQLPSGTIWSIDMTENSQILVIGQSTHNAQIYFKTHGIFTHNHTIQGNSSDVYVVDITSDGEVLLLIEWSAVRIYKNIHNQFTIFQTLAMNSSDTKAGAITDDHKWIVFGTWKSPHEVEVYKFNGIQYERNQTIDISFPVRSIALTPDNSFLIVATNSLYVYIYKHNGIQFGQNNTQTLVFTGNNKIFVSITDDHQYLTVSDERAEKVYRYFYNLTTEQFQTLDQNGHQYNGFLIHYSSISQKNRWFCVSSSNRTFLYPNIETNFTEAQILPKSSYHKFSKNDQYLILGWNDKLTVYKDCSEKEDYQIVDKQCLYCGIEGCANCQSGRCTSCIERLDYFLVKGKCQLCQIEGCLDCLNAKTCQKCDEERDYFLESDGKCKLCEIEGCKNCLSKDKCQQYSNKQQEQGLIALAVFVLVVVMVILLLILIFINTRLSKEERVAIEPYTEGSPTKRMGQSATKLKTEDMI